MADEREERVLENTHVHVLGSLPCFPFLPFVVVSLAGAAEEIALSSFLNNSVSMPRIHLDSFFCFFSV